MELLTLFPISFEFKVGLCIHWLPTMAKQHSLSYLTHSWGVAHINSLCVLHCGVMVRKLCLTRSITTEYFVWSSLSALVPYLSYTEQIILCTALFYFNVGLYNSFGPFVSRAFGWCTGTEFKRLNFIEDILFSTHFLLQVTFSFDKVFHPIKIFFLPAVYKSRNNYFKVGTSTRSHKKSSIS